MLVRRRAKWIGLDIVNYFSCVALSVVPKTFSDFVSLVIKSQRHKRPVRLSRARSLFLTIPVQNVNYQDVGNVLLRFIMARMAETIKC